MVRTTAAGLGGGGAALFAGHRAISAVEAEDLGAVMAVEVVSA